MRYQGSHTTKKLFQEPGKDKGGSLGGAAAVGTLPYCSCQGLVEQTSSEELSASSQK